MKSIFGKKKDEPTAPELTPEEKAEAERKAQEAEAEATKLRFAYAHFTKSRKAAAARRAGRESSPYSGLHGN